VSVSLTLDKSSKYQLIVNKAQSKLPCPGKNEGMVITLFLVIRERPGDQRLADYCKGMPNCGFGLQIGSSRPAIGSIVRFDKFPAWCKCSLGTCFYCDTGIQQLMGI
jgi:hypothetical protein